MAAAALRARFARLEAKAQRDFSRAELGTAALLNLGGSEQRQAPTLAGGRPRDTSARSAKWELRQRDSRPGSASAGRGRLRCGCGRMTLDAAGPNPLTPAHCRERHGVERRTAGAPSAPRSPASRPRKPHCEGGRVTLEVAAAAETPEVRHLLSWSGADKAPLRHLSAALGPNATAMPTPVNCRSTPALPSQQKALDSVGGFGNPALSLSERASYHVGDIEVRQLEPTALVPEDLYAPRRSTVRRCSSSPVAAYIGGGPPNGHESHTFPFGSTYFLLTDINLQC